jgi:hypothetical protein
VIVLPSSHCVANEALLPFTTMPFAGFPPGFAAEVQRHRNAVRADMIARGEIEDPSVKMATTQTAGGPTSTVPAQRPPSPSKK